MKIIVCVKQIPDPELPSELFQIDEEAKRVVPVANMPLVISPFDEQALEAALRIRDALGAAEIAVLTMGGESTRPMLKQALALGADAAYLLNDAAFEGADSYATALTLATAIRKIGDCDLILTGRQAADGDAGVVGCGLAELLDRPVVTLAGDVRIEDGAVVVDRVLADGMETVAAELPAVVTVSHELGAVRSASLRETMRAARKPMTAWSAADLSLDAAQTGAAGARRVLERLFIPISEIECEFIDGADAAAQAATLARRLHDEKLI